MREVVRCRIRTLVTAAVRSEQLAQHQDQHEQHDEMRQLDAREHGTNLQDVREPGQATRWNGYSIRRDPVPSSM